MSVLRSYCQKKLSLSESDPTLDQKNTRNKNTLFPKIPVVNNGGIGYHSAHFQNIKYFDLLHDFMILSRLLTNGQSRIWNKEKPKGDQKRFSLPLSWTLPCVRF